MQPKNLKKKKNSIAQDNRYVLYFLKLEIQFLLKKI